MKKRYTTYLLIAAVVLIWGVIGYKFLLGPEEEHSKELVTTKQPSHNKTIGYRLKLNYRDPFLPAPSPLPKKRELPKAIAKNKVIERRALTIRYLGTVETKRGCFYLMVERERHIILKLNDTIGGYKILKEDSDSIYLKKGKRVYGIIKQKS